MRVETGKLQSNASTSNSRDLEVDTKPASLQAFLSRTTVELRLHGVDFIHDTLTITKEVVDDALQ